MLFAVCLSVLISFTCSHIVPIFSTRIDQVFGFRVAFVHQSAAAKEALLAVKQGFENMKKPTAAVEEALALLA